MQNTSIALLKPVDNGLRSRSYSNSLLRSTQDSTYFSAITQKYKLWGNYSAICLTVNKPLHAKKPLIHKPFRPISELHAKKIKIMYYHNET